MKYIKNNTTGIPFFGKNLISIILNEKLTGSLQLFPDSNHRSQVTIKRVSLTESIFSSVVAGSIVILDFGNFSDNYNVEGFETISIKFRIETSNDIITKNFRGKITQSSVITDDAVNSDKMNSVENYRAIQIDFINSDVFDNMVITDSNYYDIPTNTWDSKDFIGWISNSDSQRESDYVGLKNEKFSIDPEV